MGFDVGSHFSSLCSIGIYFIESYCRYEFFNLPHAVAFCVASCIETRERRKGKKHLNEGEMMVIPDLNYSAKESHT